MSTHDGGAAFPFNEKHDNGDHYVSRSGMTLRDHFAGETLAGYRAHPSNGEKVEHIAAYCYRIADAMLAARQAPSAEPRG